MTRNDGPRWVSENRGYDTPCHIWQMYTRPDGYGRSSQNGEQMAHRAAWVEVYGPIERGKQVHHKCGQRSCVNVTHLELVTPKEHYSERHSYQRVGQFCPRGHRLDGANVEIVGRARLKRCVRCHRESDLAWKRIKRKALKEAKKRERDTSDGPPR